MTERKHYAREFKFDALELWRTSGKSAAQIERDMSIHKGQLHAWKRQFEKQGADAFPGHGQLPEPEAELRRLQHENALLRQERDILKKAIAIFSEQKSTVKFQFIAAQQGEFPVRRQCRVLWVSASGYYARRSRFPSLRQIQDVALLSEIHRIYQRSRQTYGSLRIHAELRAQGHSWNHERIERLMRQHRIRARCVRRFHRTPESLASLPVAPNRLNQQFSASSPNQVWTADITYLDTTEGWLYLATVLDLYSRRVVGWAMAEHMETSTVRAALQMALTQRQPVARLLHHSDRGRQYASADYQSVLAAHGLPCSMSRRGNYYDNAVQESFFGTLKSECANVHFASRTAARQCVFEYIEVWYNRQRRHSALGYLSPYDFEQVRVVSQLPVYETGERSMIGHMNKKQEVSGKVHA